MSGHQRHSRKFLRNHATTTCVSYVYSAQNDVQYTLPYVAVDHCSAFTVALLQYIAACISLMQLLRKLVTGLAPHSTPNLHASSGLIQAKFHTSFLQL